MKWSPGDAQAVKRRLLVEPQAGMIFLQVNNQDTILASYTCTPLVKFPVSSLQPGTKVMGTTIAEFGAGNTPLDMIAYSKGGKISS